MRRAPWLLVLAGSALVLGLALRWGMPDRPSAAVALHPAPSEPDRGIQPPMAASDSPPARAEVHGPDARERPAAPARPELLFGPPAPPPQPEPSVRVLAGTVTVLDSDGNRLPPGSGGISRGDISLAFQGGQRFASRQVSFEDGAWSTTLEVDEDWRRLSIRSARIDGRAVRVEEPAGDVAFPLAGELAVILRMARPASLRVVDRGTGIDLDEVCLAIASRIRGSVEIQPESGPRCALPPQASPISLDAHSALLAQPILVGAPGYAWQRVGLDASAGGERLVALEPGAWLRVGVRAHDALSGAFVRLYEPGELIHLIQASVPASGLIELAGLRPGSYRVAVEVGDWYSRLDVLAEETLELAAGQHARVDLACVRPPAAPKAPAAGIVRVPAAWGAERLKISLWPYGTRGGVPPFGAFDERVSVEAGPAPEAGPDAFRWSTSELEAGSFLLGVHSPPHHVRLEQPPGGRSDFVVEVPPPCELRVRVLDPATGEPRSHPVLHWHPRTAEQGGLVASPAATWDPGRECWVIRAPAGRVSLRLGPAAVPPHRETIELVSGLQEHVIRLWDPAGIRLRLLDAGTPVELPVSRAPMLRPLHGTGEEIGRTGSSFAPRLHVSEPGAYRLELPELPGYRQPSARIVEIEEGRFSEHRVELERVHP